MKNIHKLKMKMLKRRMKVNQITTSFKCEKEKSSNDIVNYPSSNCNNKLDNHPIKSFKISK